MCVQTKRELLEYLRDETKTFDAVRMERFSANAIGKKKNISRTLVSQYLNELFKEGQLIKINSRPVYFLHKETIRISIMKRSFRKEYIFLWKSLWRKFFRRNINCWILEEQLGIRGVWDIVWNNVKPPFPIRQPDYRFF